MIFPGPMALIFYIELQALSPFQDKAERIVSIINFMSLVYWQEDREVHVFVRTNVGVMWMDKISSYLNWKLITKIASDLELETAAKVGRGPCILHAEALESLGHSHYGQQKLRQSTRRIGRQWQSSGCHWRAIVRSICFCQKSTNSHCKCCK